MDDFFADGMEPGGRRRSVPRTMIVAWFFFDGIEEKAHIAGVRAHSMSSTKSCAL
jgi:hypothetical protein